MLALRMLHTTLAALLLAALVFTSECAAVRGDQEASSSSNAPRPALKSGILDQARLTLDTFIPEIRPDRIGKPISSVYGDVDIVHGFPSVGIEPILSVQHGDRFLQTVEYALGRYKYVYLLDPVSKNIRKLTDKNGEIKDIPIKAEEQQRVFFHSTVDPEIHALRRRVLSDPMDPDRHIQMPDPLSTDHLPHVNDVPILTSGQETLAHMKYAYDKPQVDKFWHIKDGNLAVLVHGYAWSRAANQHEDLEVAQARTRYAAAMHQYGSNVASLKYGHSIPLDVDNERGRRREPSLKDYPRFGPGASRAEMIDALQQHGRFRFYYNDPSATGAYKVKLRNLRSAPGNPMDIDVQPLTRIEQWQEALWQKIRGLRLPV